MDPLLASIILFAGNFNPRGWAFCNGQIMAIAQNTALFSLLGTTYGGNGQTTFALPDLRSRVPVHFGQGPGLSNISLGELAGSETQTLSLAQIPAHNHLINVTNAEGSVVSPINRFLGRVNRGATDDVKLYSDLATQTLNPGAVSVIGGSQPFPIRNPYLGLNFIIAIEGIFPSRN